jgi:ABC-type Fe3+ transport system permease subunit
MVFMACMKELPATLLLRPTGTDTLATRLWTETSVAAYGAAAPYAALLVLASCLPTYLLTNYAGKGRAARRGATVARTSWDELPISGTVVGP